MEFDIIKERLETKNQLVIKAIRLILEKEEEKIGMRNPIGIKDDIKKIISEHSEEYVAEEN